MKNENQEQFVLEWSASQGCFHIQSLENALEANRRRWNVKPTETFDWIPLFIGSYRACEQVARHNELKLRHSREVTQPVWSH